MKNRIGIPVPTLLNSLLILTIVLGLFIVTPINSVHAATTWTVTKADDTNDGICDTDCSLREAVTAASSGDTINFNGDYTIVFNDDIAIEKSLTISGTGHDITLDGNNTTRFFEIISGGLTIEFLTMTNGYATPIDCGSGPQACGGAIYLSRNTPLTIRNSTLSNNSAGYKGGAIFSAYNGTTTIENSTFINNQGDLWGGVIYSYGLLTVKNSTFSGNNSGISPTTGYGGVIFQSGNAINLINNTFSGNSADISGGVIFLNFSPIVTAQNNIIANTTKGGSCDFTTLDTSNLVDDNTCGISPSSDILLGTLGDYGGSTQTIPVLPGSAAIDAGSGCPATDQRGISRPQGSACDIGAFESQGFTTTLSGGNNQSTAVNTAFTTPLSINISAIDPIEPVNGGQVNFTRPAVGASASLSTNPATINSGSVSVTATANDEIGTYSINANTAGAASGANYTLTNLPTISIADVSQNEGISGSTTTFPFTVTLSHPAPPGGISFDYTSVDDTAAAGTDYTAISGNYSIPEGDSTASIPVTVSGDYSVEPDELFYIELSNPVGAVFLDNEATGTIRNDDFMPTATTDAAASILTEGATLNGTANAKNYETTISFEYGLTTAYGSSISASPASISGTDNTAVSVTLTGLSEYTEYHYRVVATSVIGTTFGSDRTFSTRAYPPTVSTNPATNISGMQATLNATANANGHSTALAFSYGKTISYGFMTAASPSPLTDTSDTPVSADITGLDPNTEYHYCIVGTSIGGLVHGADSVFKTNLVAPILTINGATSINAHEATLNATVNARNDDTTVRFEYGTDITYGTNMEAPANPYSGLSDSAISLPITGLTPDTTYHYRVIAQNGGGINTSADMTFHTSTLVFDLTSEIQDVSNNAVSYAAIGDTLHVSTTITGNGSDLDGKLNITAYHNPTCFGTGIEAGTVSPNLGIAELSDEFQLTANGLSFRAHYTDDTNYPDEYGDCISISDSPYPTVLALNETTNPQDMAVLGKSTSSLLIQFNQDVLHGSTTHADSAENPDNYLLVNAGENAVFDTTACGPLGTGGLMADDVEILINAANYDPATYLTTLQINNGQSLENGKYRLFICGTTSIIDATSTTYLNNHASDSIVTFSIAVSDSDDTAILPATGFTPNKITELAEQPSELTYGETGMRIEIPALNIDEQIVGVPGPQWDVTWLGSQIGYLQGTAFPTWSGNSVLTGHATDANGLPGTFANLGNLSWGDEITIHAWGQEYIYQIRSVDENVNPANIKTITQHEELPWITLITCHGYDEASNSYHWRTVVRAVLVKVQ